MPPPELADGIPSWLVYVLTVAAVILSIRVGSFLGRRRGGAVEGEDAPVGAVVGATLGLLAFMMAFTFGMVASRRDTRKDLLLQDVNSIGTTYLRAGLIPEPHRSEVRKLLVAYVDLRAELLTKPARWSEMFSESKHIQGEMWAHAEALADVELQNADVVALFIASLNETIDMHTKRITVSLYKVPAALWLVLAVITVFSMGVVGYQFGLSSGTKWVLTMALALSFSAVIYLIADLDRVTSSVLGIDQLPMDQLQIDLHADQAQSAGK